jgi:hypothetical protein
MWDLLDVTDKEEACATMKETVLVVCVKGDKQIRVVVTERATVMGLGSRSHVTVCKRHPDSLYTGDGPAYWRMWDLLDVTGKEEARAVMTVNGQVERLSENRVVMTERSTVMVVSSHTYRLGSYVPL